MCNINLDKTSAIIRPMMNDHTAFPPLRLQEVVKALYISAIIQMANKTVNKPNTITDGVTLLNISSTVTGALAGVYTPNAAKAGNIITQRAVAKVPAISINLMDEVEKMRPVI